ncbi:hypothetical protein GA0115255_124083, partial [Streptomyces sp. Ncost-T6T-2b]
MRSGLISLTAPTAVVLPTPNPPATRIFRVTGSTGRCSARLERPKAIDYLAENVHVRQLGRRNGTGDVHQLVLDEIADQNPYHP